MLESYIRTGDGKDYVDVDCVREALGIVDEYVDIFGVIKKLREERDGLKADLELTNRIYKEHHDFVDKVCEAVDIRRPCTESGYDNAVKLIAGFKRERDALKEKCDRMKKRANAMYGISCGYSGDKAPAFFCNVISYSWNFGLIAARSLMDEPSYPISSDSIRVELDLTPTANYKGAFDLEDLKHYIQAYGREKKLGIVESVDYQNAKTARAELAHLYKTVLGKERLDPELSPHEIMKAILDAVKQLRDAQFASDQCLRSVYMHVYEDTGYDVSDIYAAPDKLADWIITRYNSARMSSRLVALSEIDDHIDELCDKYVVVQPDRKSTTKARLDYIFAVLAENRERYNQVDKLARLRSDICIALCLGCETDNEDILKTIRKTKERHDALCKDYTELRKTIWEAMDRKPETLPEENARLVGEVSELARGEKLLIEFRDDVAKAIGMDYPTTNQVILNKVQYICKDRKDAYELVAKINDQVTALSKAKEDLQQKFEFQSGLRQQWHARYESEHEHERANGVQKALDREREACRVKDISLETAKKQYTKVCNNLETAECALNGMKRNVRELREEKTKVISALGQDIWDDCLK